MTRRLLPSRVLPGCLLGSLIASGTAHADDDELLEILDAPVVTTASQTAQTASTAPATSTSISAGELRRYGIHTLAEAIDFLALSASTAGGLAINSAPDLGARGVSVANDSGSHFLLLVDGHVINDHYNGAIALDYNIGLPLEVVDHIEVVLGPGSVLYGSNAMLGVINVVTKSTDALRGAHVVLETELPVGHRVAAFGATTLELAGAPLGVTVGAQYRHEYGPDFRLPEQRLGIDFLTGLPYRTSRDGEPTGIWGGLADDSSFSRRGDGLLRLHWENLELSVRGGIAELGQPFVGVDFDDPDSVNVVRGVTLDLRYTRWLTSQLRLGARLYGDAADQHLTLPVSSAFGCAYQNVRTCNYDGKIVTRRAGLELQAGYDWLGDGRLDTLVGVDIRLRDTGTKQDLLDWDTNAPLIDSYGIVDVDDQTLGAYAQQIWLPTPELALNAGVRLDRDPRFSPVLSPRAAANLQLWPGGTLRGIYSQAFRAPDFYQSDYGDSVLARADELRPEKVRSIEGSFEQRFGSHRALFGVFRSRWRDLIELRFLSFEEAEAAAAQGLLPLANPNVTQTQHQNSASIDSYGFNASLEGSFASSRLRYGVLFSEAYSRRDDRDYDSEPLPTAPRFKANAHLSYALGGELPSFGLAGYALSSRLADRGLHRGFQPTPYAPTQLDLRATVTGLAPFLEGLTYRLSVDHVWGNRGPYAIGSLLAATPEHPSADLSPLAPWRFTLGLEYGVGGD
ncbi:MAG TPA: TonB-dependent receptor [Polyangiaceae bacterium]|nr:TonB-dependent receptor [Polyangiaceae bacterium]